MYFVLGDLLSKCVFGAAASLVAVLLIEPGWHMLAVMVLTMPVGMVIGMVLSFPFTHWFGAMEVMIPLMFSGMFAAMIGGMWQAMSALSVPVAILIGTLTGLVVLNAVWVANVALRGVHSGDSAGQSGDDYRPGDAGKVGSGGAQI